MAEKVLIFALVRSGGSFVSQILSGGQPILTEPTLPNDGFQTPLSENTKRLVEVKERAQGFQVIKVIRFKDYLDLLEDRRVSLPEGFRPVFLFRHPYTQIASNLFVFHDWHDNWAPRHPFEDSLREYRQHFELYARVAKKYPETLLLKYEDALGEKLPEFLQAVYGDEAEAFKEYAQRVASKNFKLGPEAKDGTWEPAGYALSKKEKYWVADRLADVMEALGYGR